MSLKKYYSIFSKWLSSFSELETTHLSFVEILVLIVVGASLFGIYGYCLEYWTVHFRIDSAKWVLSAQSQASAAILGLLITAGVFRWRFVTERRDQLSKQVNLYLKNIAEARATVIPGSPRLIDILYDEFLESIDTSIKANETVTEERYIELGWWWAVRRLLLFYTSPNIEVERNLYRRDTDEILKISPIAKKAAISMWEDYWANPEKLILKLFKVLGSAEQVISRIYDRSSRFDKEEQKRLLDLSAQMTHFRGLRNSIFDNNDKLIAEQTNRAKTKFAPLFYISCSLLAVAIVSGLIMLASINGVPIQDETKMTEMLRFVVGIPIGLTVAGIYTALLTVLTIIK